MLARAALQGFDDVRDLGAQHIGGVQQIHALARTHQVAHLQVVELAAAFLNQLDRLFTLRVARGDQAEHGFVGIDDQQQAHAARDHGLRCLLQGGIGTDGRD